MKFFVFFQDFVLVYEQGSEPPEKDILRKRKKFMHNLKKSQLEFEEASSRDFFIV